MDHFIHHLCDILELNLSGHQIFHRQISCIVSTQGPGAKALHCDFATHNPRRILSGHLDRDTSFTLCPACPRPVLLALLVSPGHQLADHSTSTHNCHRLTDADNCLALRCLAWVIISSGISDKSLCQSFSACFSGGALLSRAFAFLGFCSP